ncbi:LOW QUALITY PROTEIN: osteoclast-associated immunoglobulin-like receptor [Myotis yumanensis]|uniref:LOW QUALITY PROTEIN: osteoclast-associated immunoglobulin-like receptor n=1 Tax=Myotis yumanensis TaxID=159337 RepID=UPI0038D507DA
MALVLVLQLLALSWPLCHTGVTSNGTQEAQGPRPPMYSNARTMFPKDRHRHRGGLASFSLDSFPGTPPPRPSWPSRPLPPFLPPSYPEIRGPRPFPPFPSRSYPKIKFPRPSPPFPSPPYPEIRSPRPLPPFPSLPYPEIRSPRPFPPVPSRSYPEIRRPNPLPPGFPLPYPKPRQPTYSVPPTSPPKPLPPRFKWPIDADPTTSLPKPPKPSLAAQPAAVVTPGTNVTLTCRAPQPAWRFLLYKSEEGAPVQYHYPDESLALARFFLEAVTEAQGGSYRCEYHNHRGRSHPSDALELMVTDLLPRPSLEALPGPRAPGAPVSLRCTGRARNMSFALYRADEPTPVQFRESEQPWADFPLPRAQAPGTYTCYYHTPTAPYVLSPRSDPLVVSLEGSGSKDYTMGNVVRLVLAGLVLILLAALVGWEWRSWRRASDRSLGGLELHPAA